jgi:hypothetical protein
MFRKSMMWFSSLGIVLLLFPGTSREGQSPISRVTVGVNYSRYNGSCPANLRFTANIYVDRVPMSYNYEWERSDGAKSGERVVRSQ